MFLRNIRETSFEWSVKCNCVFKFCNNLNFSFPPWCLRSDGIARIVIQYCSSYFSKISDDQYLLTVFKLEAKVSDCHAYWLWKWDMPGICVKCQSNKRKTFVNNPMRSEKKYMSVILINMMATKKKFISKKKYAFTWKF